MSRASRNYRKKRDEWRRQETGRRPQLEQLEARQLMAVGPQLAGIQTNDGTLLRAGQVRQTAPNELTFHFNDAADLNVSTIASGIQLFRAGEDGAFERAVATTDFNTNGQAVMDFTAVQPGQSGNGIAINFIKNDLGAGVGPRVTVQGESILVELNSRIGSQTTAAQLRTAINNHAQASQIVTASLRNNATGTVNIAAPAITYSPVVTGGANAASVVSNLNVGGSFQVKLTSKTAGPAGNGIEVIVNRTNFGGVRPPDVTVNNRTITVNVNSNPASPTTAREFVDAINAHAQASSLVQAAITIGSPDTLVGNRVTSGTRLRLTGVKDVSIVPGYIGLGDSSREVVMRFSAPLPDDLYHVEILGTGTGALRNVNGGAFGDTTDDGADNGADFHLNFELDLGAQITAVVPQPISRNVTTNVLQQARNRIEVYFNNDDLWPTAVSTGQLATNPTVVDPAFYQLIFTNDTVHNQDDVVYRPTSIQYNPATDMAVLQFSQNLEQLGSGAGTFRLRIGTDESAPLMPVATSLSNFGQATTDFGTRGGATVLFQQQAASNTAVTIEFTKSDRGVSGLPSVTVVGTAIKVDLNSRAGSETTAAQVVTAINGSTAASALVTASLFNTPSGSVNVATSAATPFTVTVREVGSSFDSALNLAVLGNQGQIITSAITPQAYDLEFPGALTDPGHRDIPYEV
ncbi:MAG: hypothetical protein AB7O38_09240, partial [Pirellulaceae bacterium]